MNDDVDLPHSTLVCMGVPKQFCGQLLPFDKSFDALRTAIAQELCVKDAILDGEIVCLDGSGRSMFKELLFWRGNPVCRGLPVPPCPWPDLSLGQFVGMRYAAWISRLFRGKSGSPPGSAGILR